MMKTQIAPIYTSASESALLDTIERWRADGQTVAWTNGCFDLLHCGHIQSIGDAAAVADRLVVGVNSDSSVRANKGDGRPIVSEMDRAMTLAGVRGVDAVLIFGDTTPIRLIEMLRPDVHCKGEDYLPCTGRAMPERAIVEGYGGRVAYLPLRPGTSTTEIVQRIKRCAS